MFARHSDSSVLLCWTLSDQPAKIIVAESGLVHAVVGTAGNVSDVSQTCALLRGEETLVFGDAGYQGVRKREENRDIPVSWHAAMKRSHRTALPGDERGQLREKAEKVKASIRAKVEHPFHVVKNLFKHRVTRYRGLSKSEAKLFTMFNMANLVLARRRLLEVCTQGAS